MSVPVLLVAKGAESKHEQTEEKHHDDSHAHAERDEGVVEITLRERTAQCQVGRGAEDVSNSGENADYEEGANREDGSSKVSEDGVRNVEQDYDDQDAVDGGHDGRGERSPVAEKIDYRPRENDDRDEQETDDDRVLDADDQPTNTRVGHDFRTLL